MFKSTSKNLGILCRGKSLQNLNKFEDNFDKCFIINDFKKEIERFENILKKKRDNSLCMQNIKSISKI